MSAAPAYEEVLALLLTFSEMEHKGVMFSYSRSDASGEEVHQFHTEDQCRQARAENMARRIVALYERHH